MLNLATLRTPELSFPLNKLTSQSGLRWSWRCVWGWHLRTFDVDWGLLAALGFKKGNSRENGRNLGLLSRLQHLDT